MTASSSTDERGTEEAVTFAAGAWSKGGHLSPPDTTTDAKVRNLWRMVEGSTRWAQTILDRCATDRDPMTRQPTSDELVTICARALVIYENHGNYTLAGGSEQALELAQSIIAEAVRRLERDAQNGESNGHDGESSTDKQPLRRFRLISDTELEQQPLPEQLIEGLLVAGSHVMLVGEPGSLKSFLALDWAYHIVRGRRWAGRKVKQGAVLYILAEGRGQFSLRTLAWKQVHDE